MNLHRLQTAYREVARRHELPAMDIARVAIQPLPFQEQDQDLLQRRLRDFAPVTGWLCFQSLVCDIDGDNPLRPADADTGLLLCGECVNARGESLHLRQDGRGGWLATLYRPGEGDEFLIDQVSFLSHEADEGRRGRRLCYRRYWTVAQGTGVRQYAACFTGFRD